MNLVDVYDYALALAGMVILVWFVHVVDAAYSASLTPRRVLFIAGSAVFFTALLWAIVRPRSASMRLKVLLYGLLSGMVIAIGVLGWSNLWLPEIPMGG